MIGMRWGSVLAGGAAVLVGVGLLVLGISMAAVTDDVFGEPWHPHGSLGLAIAVTGGALMIAGGWLAVASPSARSAWRTIDTPGRLGLIGGTLVGAAIVLFTFTDQVGGAIMYHPYDWLGLEMLAIAALVWLRAGWWIAAAHPPRRR